MRIFFYNIMALQIKVQEHHPLAEGQRFLKPKRSLFSKGGSAYSEYCSLQRTSPLLAAPYTANKHCSILPPFSQLTNKRLPSNCNWAKLFSKLRSPSTNCGQKICLEKWPTDCFVWMNVSRYEWGAGHWRRGRCWHRHQRNEDGDDDQRYVNDLEYDDEAKQRTRPAMPETKWCQR